MKKLLQKLRWYLWHKLGPGPTVVLKPGGSINGAIIHGGIQISEGCTGANNHIDGHGFGTGITVRSK